MFCTNKLVERCAVSLRTRETAQVFPLYVYLNDRTGNNKAPNFKTEFYAYLSNKKELCGALTPKNVFFYIYAILHSQKYRQKYSEQLCIDFPKIPFTYDKNAFVKLSKFGKKLVNLHLLKSKELGKKQATYPVKSLNDEVTKISFDSKNGRVYINKNKYFGNISEDVWNFRIGGYQVLYKWLKSRMKRNLSHWEILTFLKIVSAINHTIELMKEIDKIYPKVEEKLIDRKEFEKCEVEEKQKKLTHGT